MTSIKSSLIPIVSLTVLLAAGCGSLLENDAASDSPVGSSSQPPPVSTELPPTDEPVASSDKTPSAPPPLETEPSPSPAAQNLDTTIIPGERVGPITQSTSRQDLVALFGEERLTDVDVPVGEGFTESGTEIALDDGRTLSVLWVNNSQSGVQEVRQLGPTWQTPEGVHVGMSLNDFKQVAGSFELYGFGWDYGGTVVLENSQLNQYADSLILRLAIQDPAAAGDSQAYRSMLGDGLYSSSDSHLDDLNPYIDEMIVTLTPPRQ